MSGTPHKIVSFKGQLGYQVTVSGVVTTTIIAGLTGTKLDVTTDKVSTTDHSTTGWKSSLPGLSEWKVTAKLQYIALDPTHEYLRTAALGQQQITIIFYPEQATGSGEDSYSGPAYITGWSVDAEGDNKAEEMDLSFEGIGPLTLTAQ